MIRSILALNKRRNTPNSCCISREEKKAMASHSTYYDRRLRQGPALVRARRPYIFKNALTGLGLFALVSGVYYYTITAVGQDDFADVKVPDAPRKPAQAK